MMNASNCYEIARVLGGVPILGALPNSPAARAGIRFGDVLLEYNGRRTESVSAFLAARAAAEGDEGQVTARVVRDGVEMDIVLDMSQSNHDRDLMSVMRHVVESRAVRPVPETKPPSA